MNSDHQIATGNINRDATVSLIINSTSQDRNVRNEENSFCTSIGAFHDWWICTSIITKVKILGFVFLPCLAIGLYIFHYMKHPEALHNPIAVLHPLAVVHPVIPSPFHSAVTFIEEAGKNIFKNSFDVPILTKNGPIVGRRYDPNPATGASYDAFLGIPYGHIPARFERAVPVDRWTDSRPAQSDGPPCPQPGVDFSEDCLFINVFTPTGAADSSTSYPVIAFIHGSAFTFSSSSSKELGPDFLVPEGIVLVTLNYRLGAIGFLTLGSKEVPGNMGLFDTHLALLWVQNEISGFGGDPKRVTLMGQSAGSILAMYHYLSPSSSGLFRHVIAHSGSALAGWGHYSAAEGTSRAKSLALAVGCDTSVNDTTLLTCLQKTNITDIVANQYVPIPKRFEAAGETMAFLPVLDTFFAVDPFFKDSLQNLLDKTVNRSKPLILGFTADEGICKFAESCWKIVEANLDAFIPAHVLPMISERRKTALVNHIRNRYFRDSITNNKVLDIISIFQDHMMMYPVLQVARKLANTSYGYVFKFNGPWTPDPAFIAQFHVSGVNHGYDLRYLFYNAEDPQDLGNCSSLRNSLKIRDMMVHWWVNFVKTGTPGVNWTQISQGGYLEISTNAAMVNTSTVENYYNYDFWASLETASDIPDSSATFATFNFLMVLLIAMWCIMVSLAI